METQTSVHNSMNFAQINLKICYFNDVLILKNGKKKYNNNNKYSYNHKYLNALQRVDF